MNEDKLKNHIKEVLYHSHGVDPSELDISVEAGIVHLKGTIQSESMKKIAEDLIASIPGVEDVFTHLKIGDTANFQLSEKALKEARSTGES